MGKSSDEVVAVASSLSPTSLTSSQQSSNNNARFIKSIALNKLNSYNTLLTNKSNNFYPNNSKKSTNSKAKVLVRKPFLLEASGTSVNNSNRNSLDDTKLSFRASFKPSQKSFQIESNATNSGNNTKRPLTVGPFRQVANGSEMALYPSSNDYNTNNLPPIMSIKNAKFSNIIRGSNRHEGRRSGASDGYIGKSRIRDRSNPRVIHLFNNGGMNSGGSTSANVKNRNFVSFLALNQQNEKKRLKSQISKMCSISFKKLDEPEELPNHSSVNIVKNGNYSKSNLINLSDFTNRFESLDLNNQENEEDGDDLRKISVLNNYFSNSIVSNYNNISGNNNNDENISNNSNNPTTKSESHNDESNLNTQRTNNNNNNSASFIQKRPDSLLSDRCKSEFFDDDIQYDNDNENYYDM